jgi:Zn finger protein HypA/HybF involved in hydrogenase expression
MMWNVSPVRDNMNCYNCNNELIWGGDHDIEEENEEYIMETNLSCPKCNSFVIIYTPKEKL